MFDFNSAAAYGLRSNLVDYGRAKWRKYFMAEVRFVGCKKRGNHNNILIHEANPVSLDKNQIYMYNCISLGLLY